MPKVRMGRGRYGWLPWVTVTLVVFTGLYLAAMASFVRTGGPHDEGYPPPGGNPHDRMRMVATMLALDPVANVYKLRLQYRPEGDYRGDGATLARPVSLTVDDIGGAQTSRYEAGQRIPTPDISVAALGDTANYPFDPFMLDTSIRDPAGHQVPTEMRFVHAIDDWTLRAQRAAPTADGRVALSVTARRAPPVLMLSLGLMGVLVVLAVANTMMVARAIRLRKVEFATLASLGAMLFAIPGIRNAMPNTPPVGSLSDFLVFFWALMIVGICLAVSAIAWLRHAATEMKVTPPEVEHGGYGALLLEAIPHPRS